jgi:beta-glucosidase
VLGRLAHTVNLGDRGSSDVWDLDCHTVLDGVRGLWPDASYDSGDDLQRAAEAAAQADVAFVVAGYTYADEGEYIGETPSEAGGLFPPQDEPEVVERYRAELDALPETTMPDRFGDPRAGGFARGGDRSSLRLPPEDVALIRAVAAANPRTVVVLQAGSAVIVEEWQHEVAAIVQSWYGGSEAGPGLVDVLVGDVDPSGRLPFTVPRDERELPAFDRDARAFTYDRWHGWWHFARTGAQPAFPFGFGLSYTTFAVGSVEAANDADGVTISGTLANTGSRDGADVVQVYVELPDPEAPMRLAGFTRVDVPAGDHAAFAVSVPRARLATRDPERHGWMPPAGSYRFTVAGYAGDPDARTVAVDL